MSAFIRNVGKSFKAESVSLKTRFGRRTVGGKHFRNIGPLRGVSAATGFTCDSADFDGTNDYMLRGGGLTGAVDGSQGIFSCWFRIDGTDAATKYIFGNTNAAKTRVHLDTNNNIVVDVRDATGALVFTATTATAFSVGATWHHIICSWDTNFIAGSKLMKMVVDGATESPSISDVAVAFNVDYTVTEWNIGARSDGVALYDGCLAELYFNSVTYLDVTQAANLAKWRTVGGKPEDLGVDGSTPTGTAPIVYQRIADGAAASSFATNLGSGGNFSITGTLDTGSSSPSD